MTRSIAYDASEWYSSVPRSISKHVTVGLLVLGLSFGGFGAWAFRAPLAAAVISPGTFVATGNNQTVQHLEGGIIREILVTEGARVEKGDPLIRLDETAAEARLRELFLRRARLEIMTTRLLAEYHGQNDMPIPDFLQQEADDPAVSEIIRNQELNFEVSKMKTSKDISILQSNITALENRLEGYKAQHQSLEEQIAYLDEDIATQSALFEKRLVSKSQINSLQRARAEGIGQKGRILSQIAETHEMISKQRSQIEQARTAHKEAALDELQVTEGELDSVREQYRNAFSIRQRATIEAPVTGTVVRMNYNTPGGVIESGKSIAEILPAGAPLIIETEVPRKNIDSVQIGQTATVRLTALNQRTTPVLTGEVFYVSADALPDTTQMTPREVYLARVRLTATELNRVKGFTPTPGMPAEVMIQAAERTFFEYLSKPIVDSMSRAFRER